MTFWYNTRMAYIKATDEGERPSTDSSTALLEEMQSQSKSAQPAVGLPLHPYSSIQPAEEASSRLGSISTTDYASSSLVSTLREASEAIASSKAAVRRVSQKLGSF